MTVRCLIVDDSATMRAMLNGLLSRDPDIEVVGTACNALVAREMVRELSPDVITLDVEMPQMSGLDFLERLMRLRPTPVIMCSSLTARGAEVSLRALELGAIDCYAKPEGRIQDLVSQDGGALAALVKQAAGARRRRQTTPRISSISTKAFVPNDKVVVIGASTGGVEALTHILKAYPANCPPTLIVQHMPAAFTAAFAARLNNLCVCDVREAVDGAVPAVGQVHIAPGGLRHLVLSRGARLQMKLVQGDAVAGHRPSVDMLLVSVAELLGPRGVGALLTGMGRDGAEGLLRLRQAGGQTIGQDEASSVVFGMPRAAAAIDACETVLPLDRIGRKILDLCSR